MSFDPAPFDVVEGSRQVWLSRWSADAASGMAVFTAILRAQQVLMDEVNAVVRGHGLTFARYEVLAWLATDPEPPPTLSWISRTLRIPPATVTDIIDHLETRGLVRRVTHPSDARTTLAEITDEGRRRATAATADLNTGVYEPLALAEDDRSAVVDLLRRLRVGAGEFDTDRSDAVVEAIRGSSADHAEPTPGVVP